MDGVRRDVRLSEPPGRGVVRNVGRSGRHRQVPPPHPGRFSGAGWWLPAIIGIGTGIVVSLLVRLVFAGQEWVEFDGRRLWGADLLALLLAVLVVCAAWRLARQQHREGSEPTPVTPLVDTVPAASAEWVWAIGRDGRFAFSDPGCRDLTGYEPSELVGRHHTLVIGSGDLAAALRNSPDTDDCDGAWTGLVTECQHQNGTRTKVMIHGTPLWDAAGEEIGFEGTARALDTAAGDGLGEVRDRIEAMLAERTLLTAFQPIRSLTTGAVIGAEALTRFLSSPGLSPEAWFVQAASVGLGAELEILAIQIALEAAGSLPDSLYVAVNVSPLVCLDGRLPDVLETSRFPVRRLVLEITERQQVDNYEPLAAALAPLRRAGVRIAVDDAGAGFASMRHILQLRPDLVKLDREIITGIDTDPGQRALGRAMAGFTTEIGAVLIAEGIETRAVLDTVTSLGMGAGQGYLLGRPSVSPQDWAHWLEAQPPSPHAGHADDPADN